MYCYWSSHQKFLMALKNATDSFNNLLRIFFTFLCGISDHIIQFWTYLKNFCNSVSVKGLHFCKLRTSNHWGLKNIFKIGHNKKLLKLLQLKGPLALHSELQNVCNKRVVKNGRQLVVLKACKACSSQKVWTSLRNFDSLDSNSSIFWHFGFYSIECCVIVVNNMS